MTTPTSGPGALSRRTDTGPAQKLRELPDAEYGEAATYKDLQQQAPLAQSQGAGAGIPAQGNPYADSIVPLSAGSQNPGTPVTDGAAVGEGAGLEALGINPQSQQDMERWLPYLPVLEDMANREGASWAMRNVVRQLKAMV